MEKKECEKCRGLKLKKESLYFKIDNKNISEVSNMYISDLSKWAVELESKLNKREKIISKEILKEINTRLNFLMNVGLDYLSLNRTANTLSGGEMQRIRLATQIGSQLVGVLYVLDEPSIGLHQRDNDRLIKSLKELRDLGNSVLVVEHDKDMMLNADHIIDIGPKAGRKGGEIIWEGDSKDIKNANTITADYINNKTTIEVNKEARKGSGKFIELIGAKGNNLKNVNLKLPLGKMIFITGVSGSGKSSLINNTLYPILSNNVFKASKKNPLEYDRNKRIREYR